MTKKSKKQLVEIDRRDIDIVDLFDDQSLNKIINYFLDLNEEYKGIYTSFSVYDSDGCHHTDWNLEIIKKRFESDIEFEDRLRREKDDRSYVRRNKAEHQKKIENEERFLLQKLKAKYES